MKQSFDYKIKARRSTVNLQYNYLFQEFICPLHDLDTDVRHRVGLRSVGINEWMGLIAK